MRRIMLSVLVICFLIPAISCQTHNGTSDQHSSEEQSVGGKTIGSSNSIGTVSETVFEESQKQQTSEETTRTHFYTKADQEFISFEESARSSDVGVKAVYKGRIEGTKEYQEIFEVKDVLFGTCENTIHVYGYYGETESTDSKNGKVYTENTSAVKYKEGSTYILLLDRWNYLFYDYPRYIPYTGQLLDLEENSYTLFGKEINFSGLAPEDYILKCRDKISEERSVNPVRNPAPIKEGKDAVETMALNSLYVGLLKLESVSIEETNHNGMVYCATIIQMFTAEPENRKEDDSILIVLDREKTEVGQTYLCGFDPVEEHSLLYTQMTLDGLFSAEDEAAVSEARAFFGK